MRLFIILTILSFNVLGQTQKEVKAFHDHFILPYNTLALKISDFTAAALQQSSNNVLIAKRNETVVAMKALNAALKTTKPIDKDFTLLSEVKSTAASFDKYIHENLMKANLASAPAGARENIKTIQKLQKINKQFAILGERILVRQRKLFTHYKFTMTKHKDSDKLKRQRESMNYYYNISVSELKVQAQIDDFVDANNITDLAKMKSAKAKGILQVNKALVHLNKQKLFYGDSTVIEDSKKVLQFYKVFFVEKTTAIIELSSFPDPVPDHKIDAYNKSIDESNASFEYYSGLQTILNASTAVSSSFFKTHIK